MGLNYPEDLEAWRRWQRSRNRLRSLKSMLRKPQQQDLVVIRRGDAPTVLFALDAVTPSALAAVMRPAAHIPASSFAVLAPRDVAKALFERGALSDGSADLGAGIDLDASGSWQVLAVDDGDAAPATISSIRVVVSAGHFLSAGAFTYRWSIAHSVPYCVVQHGLLTPFAPPLPRNARLFAFSHADAEFWRSGRRDIEVEAVGSQMLWDAAQANSEVVTAGAPPVFLGQLHGAELPRRVSARTATAFCTKTGGSYRPHPAETDRLSRWQHDRWRKRGIEIETAAAPLLSGRPVVAIFSTGVLEAAAAGVPAWVTCVDPPAWVREFWTRYGLAEWGGEPTPRPLQPAVEPSVQIARRIQELGEQ